MMMRLLTVGVGAIAVLLVGAQTQAEPWANPSGTAPSGHFTWDSGHDDYGCFNDPTVTPDDRFVFRFASMGISVQNGVSDSVGDSVYFNIHIMPGYNLTQMEVRARGSWLVQGEGSQVDLSALLSIAEYEAQPGQPGPRTFSDELTTTPVTFPLAVGDGQPASGTWAGLATEVLNGVLPGADDDLHISFADLLTALAGPTGTAQLNLSFQQAEFEIVLIPEPATLLLLTIGGFALLRRR
jgi:hypothetical protein